MGASVKGCPISLFRCVCMCICACNYTRRCTFKMWASSKGAPYHSPDIFVFVSVCVFAFVLIHTSGHSQCEHRRRGAQYQSPVVFVFACVFAFEHLQRLPNISLLFVFVFVCVCVFAFVFTHQWTFTMWTSSKGAQYQPPARPYHPPQAFHRLHSTVSQKYFNTIHHLRGAAVSKERIILRIGELQCSEL